MRNTILIAVVCAFLATPALADPYTFKQISGDDVGSAAGSWFSVTISEIEGGVSFKFLNEAPTYLDDGKVRSPVITDVFFFDGKLINAESWTLGGTAAYPMWTQYEETQSMPGFGGQTVALYAAEADSPAPKYGIFSGQYLTVDFDLLEGVTVANVIDSLYLDGAAVRIPDTLQIGIKVQCFEGGGSAEFVLVPVPGAVLLGFLGLGYAGMRLRREV